jgi:hypothetical protein
MSVHAQREPSGVRRPSPGDAAGGGEAEAAKLSAGEPGAAESPVSGDSVRASDAASNDEERRGRQQEPEHRHEPEDAPAS